jgi:hypothetical protein
MPNSLWLYAGGGGAVVSAAVTIVLAVVRGRTKAKLAALKKAKAGDVPAIIADLVTMYKIDTSAWPPGDQKEVALSEIGLKNSRNTSRMVLALTGMLLFAAVTIVALLKSPGEPTEGKPTLVIDRKVD